MARQGLVARQKRRWRTTTDSKHREPIAPNILARNFTAAAPNRVRVADTTYLPVITGFLFLVVIIDLYSRKVVGWAMADCLDAELSSTALPRGLAARVQVPGSSSTRIVAQNSQPVASGRFSVMPTQSRA